MKKIIALFLTVLILLSSSVYIFADVDTSVVNGIVPGRGMRYYYRDDYFALDASVYQPSFSSMSYWVSLTSSASGNDENQSRYLRELLTQIGFSGYELNNDYIVESGDFTMGVAVAYKNINVNGSASTVLAIVPRSMNYGSEWVSNFTLGTSGEAAGFSDAAGKVEEFVNEYTIKHAGEFASNVKAWIVGYSRGAAVANLVAGHYTKSGAVGTVSVDKENIYGYTFETPRAANTSYVSAGEAKSYTNIHNIISNDDVVTKLAPEKWNFIRYGTDEEISFDSRTESNANIYDAAISFTPSFLLSYNDKGEVVFASENFKTRELSVDLSVVSQLGSFKYVDGELKWQGVDFDTAVSMLTKESDKKLGEFWVDAFTSLTIGVGSRKNYAEKVEAPLTLILSESTGIKYSSETVYKAFALFFSGIIENKESVLMAALSLNKDNLSAVLQGIINDAVETAGIDSSLYSELGAQLTNLLPHIVATIIADVTLYKGAELFGFFDNYDTIFNPHYTEQSGAWVLANDPNYNPSADVARVKSVKVNITQTKTEKKILFVKTTTTANNVEIIPDAETPVLKIEYRTSKLSGWTAGNSYSTKLSVGKIFIRITDARGIITEWEYNNGSTVKTK